MNYPNETTPQSHLSLKPWYKRPKFVILTFVLFLISIFLLSFLFQTGQYLKDIKEGRVNIGNIPTQGQTKISNLPNTSSATLAVPRFQLETKDDPSLGNPQAKVVVVEFGDFECPFCLKSFPIFRELQQEFKDEVLFIWRDFPLRDIHPNAQKAAEAGECAQEQGKFWEYHDKLFINQSRLTVPDLKRYAAQLGMDIQQFSLCLDSGRYQQEVEEDLQTVIKAGGQGTPTFFVNGRMISGVVPKEVFRKIILSFLKSEN